MGSIGSVGYAGFSMDGVIATPDDTSKNAGYTNDFLAKTGVDVSSTIITKVDGDVLKNTYDVMEQQMTLYPEYTSQLKEITDYGNNASFAATHGNDMLTNIAYFGNTKTLDAMYQRTVESGFHPKGTTWKDIVTHEMGHVVVRGLINKAYSTDAARAKAWGGSKFSGDIVRSATKQVQDNYKAYGFKTKPTQDALRKGISGYATKNYHETIAEAWADYHANGNNSQPLSRAVYDVIRKMM